ncbi:hypothetical protein TNCV_4145671 [Trichonephila clavipes]|nr:hypothetical protein TNCV_4145671 [Trichonephila clavipes]
MIVLSWIRKESYQLKTFVANRIATIQEMTSSEQWRYVATEDNPADFVSRGMDSLKLKTCELWWNGPKFLMSNQYPQRQIPVAVIKDPGRSITSIVEPDLTNLNENRLDNWQKITKIIQLIWKRWSVDYLNSLQQRNKWHFEKKNAKIGDMVIIKEDNLPSCQWSLGRINNIYPGKNSKVRVVEVKTTREELERAEKMRLEELVEEQALKEKQLQLKFDLERFKIESGFRINDESNDSINICSVTSNLNLKKLIPDFDPKQSDISLYLVIFERQAKRASIEKKEWVGQLLGLLPLEIVQFIAREPEEQAENYDYVKTLLLKRFKSGGLSAKLCPTPEEIR